MVAKFKGFSTVDRIRAPYTLEGRDLVKRDLLNTFYTKKGERLMRPNYGSVIWDLLMNPDDTATEKEIRDDVDRIIDSDPRVDLLDTVIIYMDHTIRIEINLKYVLLNDSDTLYLEYTRDIEGE
jgi:phage baseplate assembly protein W